MIFYANIIDKKSGLCAVGTGANTEKYKSLGMEEKDVEQSEVDGKWYLKPLCPHYTDEEKLNNAKADKLAQLKAISQKYTVNDCDEMFLTSSLGYAINADKTAQDNIRGLIEAHEETDLIKYKLYDNSFKDITIADLKIMLKECAQNGENLYTQKFLYQAQINACTSIEEVNAIEIVFEMMDFSKSDTETDSE